MYLNSNVQPNSSHLRQYLLQKYAPKQIAHIHSFKLGNLLLCRRSTNKSTVNHPKTIFWSSNHAWRIEHQKKINKIESVTFGFSRLCQGFVAWHLNIYCVVFCVFVLCSLLTVINALLAPATTTIDGPTYIVYDRYLSEHFVQHQ